MPHRAGDNIEPDPAPAIGDDEVLTAVGSDSDSARGREPIEIEQALLARSKRRLDRQNSGINIRMPENACQRRRPIRLFRENGCPSAPTRTARRRP